MSQYTIQLPWVQDSHMKSFQYLQNLDVSTRYSLNQREVLVSPTTVFHLKFIKLWGQVAKVYQRSNTFSHRFGIKSLQNITFGVVICQLQCIRGNSESVNFFVSFEISSNIVNGFVHKIVVSTNSVLWKF